MDEAKKDIKNSESQFKKFFENKTNIWMSVSIVLAIALVLALVWPSGINQTQAESTLLDYLNGMVGGGVTGNSIADKGLLYEVTVDYQGQEIPVYITKDGKYMVQGVAEISPSDDPITGNSVANTQTDVPKTDKPLVELFVMSYCPYGTQAEKGFIPMVEALGNKIDAKVRFVHYVLHGDKETQENYRQICIREEQGDKFWEYLKCTLDSTDPNAPADVIKCMTNNGINVAKVDDCIANRAADLYAQDSELSQAYGVQGSPTLIINGVESSAGRNAASYLSGVCNAFNSEPGECSASLTSTNPSPGFGYSSDGSDVAASCGA
ncbi:MAG: thioredoxin domain-containing protein [archaeon]|nr:thioredoxin domain-containing protein [archaeon]